MGISRRRFIGSAVASAGAAYIGSASGLFAEQNGKLRIAQIGCGGRGKAHYGMWRGNDKEFVAAVDTRRNVVNQFNEKALPNLRKYTDFREMYAKQMDGIDAVIVCTPDHTHYAAAMTALMNGKAVYCEKPLAWSMDESLELARMAKKMKVPTQMGNQGNAKQGWRDVYSMVHQDVIGDVEEVHTWTNRPVWPQGQPCKEGGEPVPDNLDWDSWIGPAPMRPYRPEIQPFKWRGYNAYGCGALGDMACHTMNAMFQTLKPGFDCAVEPLKIVNATECMYPDKEIIKWHFAKSGDCPGFEAYWYDGNLKPEKPEDMGDHALPGRGVMFKGTKGVIISQGDYNGSNTVYKQGKKVEPEYKQLVEPNDGDIHQDFLNAAMDKKPWDSTISNFMYAGKMTAIINMGPIAQKVGEKITFSSDTMKFDNPKANELMGRKPRKGWEKPYQV